MIKTLQRMADLDIPTLAYDIDSWAELDSFTQELASRLGVDAEGVRDRYDVCLAKVSDASKLESALRNGSIAHPLARLREITFPC